MPLNNLVNSNRFQIFDSLMIRSTTGWFPGPGIILEAAASSAKFRLMQSSTFRD
jgi:hypothetical protein